MTDTTPEAADKIRRLTTELERAREDLAFIGRNTLPELRREVEYQQEGKRRWRGRAEKAEARVAELEAAASAVVPAADRAEPEPSDPTQCDGEEGFCPEHGFHRHSLKQPGAPEPAADRAAVLREAVRRIEDGEPLPDRDLRFRRGADWVLDALRRLAAEAAVVPAVGVAADTTPAAPDEFQVWPIKRILAEVRCGSKDWPWEDEWADLARRHAETGYLDRLAEQIAENGITMPVLIGSDGRLWDGHHRLCVAVRLGIGYVPVEIVPSEREQPNPTAPDQRCTHCGEPVRLITGTLSAWWVHDPDGHTACHPAHAAASTRAEPVPAQPGTDTPVVAYLSHSGSLLRCLTHAPEWAAILTGAFHPVTAGDLPDGGVCTYRAPGVECGADVLIPQQPKEA